MSGANLAAVAVHKDAVGNAAGGSVTGHFAHLFIVAHDGEELDVESLDESFGGGRCLILAEEDDIHLSGFLDIIVEFDNLGHFAAAGAAPAGGEQVNEVVGLFIHAAFDFLHLLHRGHHGAGGFLRLLLFLPGRTFGHFSGIILGGDGQGSKCQ